MAEEGIQTEAQTVGITAAAPAPAGPAAPWSGLVLFLVWLNGELCVAFVAGLIFAAERALGRALPPLQLAMWATLVALPLRLLSGVLTVRATSDARLADMGLTTRHLLADVLRGFLVAWPLAVVVYGVQHGCEGLLKVLPGGKVDEHPFAKMAKEGLTPELWAVLIVAAVIAAPLWEEFLFRGLIQPWAMTRRWGGWVLMGIAVALAAAARLPRLDWHAEPAAVLVAASPLLAVLTLVPVHAVLDGLGRVRVAGLFAAAVLFGWFHVAVWPSPVALALLGLGLGWLRWRTGGLAAPMALHATFNAIAVAVLVWQGPRS